MKYLLILLLLASPLFGRDYKATDIRVIDGDTIHATLYLGLDTYKRVRVRLLGVSTPEWNEQGGSEATAFLQKLIDEGEGVIVHIPEEKYSFRRILGHVTIDGAMVSDSIREAGHAQ